MLDLCMSFNAKKSMVLRFGSNFKHVCKNVCLNKIELPFVEKAKYLGLVVLSGK